MAKVSLLKVTPLKNLAAKTVEINGQEVLVAQHLSINDKAEIINALVADVFDENYIASPVRLQIYFYLAVIKKYTNINITETQMRNAAQTYDLLEVNGVFDAVIENIPEEEFNDTFELVNDSIQKVAEYYHSFLGVVKMSSQDYKNTDMDIDQMMKTLQNPEELGLVKNILEKIQ